MGHQDSVKGIRYKEVYVLRIGLTHVYYLMYFHYPLLLVIHVILLDKVVDLLLYFSPSVMHRISAEILYVCQTVADYVETWRLKLCNY